jgi:hypothetical protein
MCHYDHTRPTKSDFSNAVFLPLSVALRVRVVCEIDKSARLRKGVILTYGRSVIHSPIN